MEPLTDLLGLFAEAHALSGYEDQVRDLLAQELKPLVNDLSVDKLGNVIGIRKGTGPTVMVAAHMDEIGFMVSHVDSDGFLRFVPVGGWFAQTALSQRVLIHTADGKSVAGVIGSRPPHMMEAEDRKKVVKLKDMFIDCGATSAEDALEMGVHVGAPVTVDRDLRPLGGKLVTGKALDNRAGCVVMLGALRLLKDQDLKATVQAVGTVQEEVGLKGARTSAYGLSPDVAIATDVTIPGDHPGVTQSESAVTVGKGPVITIMDAGGRGVITPRSVLSWLKETAEQGSLPYQLQVGDAGNTDATAIHITKTGIPCGVVSIPARYIHSPVEVLSLEDLENGASLLAAAIQSAHKHF